MTFSCLHMYYSLVYQITQGATSYTHVLKVHVQTETRSMVGIAFFPVLAAWLKQKCRGDREQGYIGCMIQ